VPAQVAASSAVASTPTQNRTLAGPSNGREYRPLDIQSPQWQYLQTPIDVCCNSTERLAPSVISSLDIKLINRTDTIRTALEQAARYYVVCENRVANETVINFVVVYTSIVGINESNNLRCEWSTPELI
jgi:hypothetical protein